MKKLIKKSLTQLILFTTVMIYGAFPSPSYAQVQTKAVKYFFSTKAGKRAVRRSKRLIQKISENKPCIYQFTRSDGKRYVGKSIHCRTRLLQHLSTSVRKELPIPQKNFKIHYVKESRLKEAEKNIIRALDGSSNVIEKGTKKITRMLVKPGKLANIQHAKNSRPVMKITNRMYKSVKSTKDKLNKLKNMIP